MADNEQWPRQGLGSDVASLTNNWSDFRNRVAQWNSGASNEKPTVETMSSFFGGNRTQDEELYKQMLTEYLAQILRDRSKPGASIFDDPEVGGVFNNKESSRYLKK